MAQGRGERLELTLHEASEGPASGGYTPVTLSTSRGQLRCRYCPAQQRDAGLGAIWLGGAGGDFDSPGRDLYGTLCQELAAGDISSLRVRYRRPNMLEECALDALAGVAYLELEGCRAIALVGHSFGGAVAIQAAAAAESVRTVVTLATQSMGARPAAVLSPRCSILLIHGSADNVLPPSSSEYVYELASEPKQLRILEGAGHGLDEVADEAHELVRDWVTRELAKAPIQPPSPDTSGR